MAHGHFFSKKIDFFWNQKVAATYVAKLRSPYTTQASPPSRYAFHRTETRKIKAKRPKAKRAKRKEQMQGNRVDRPTAYAKPKKTGAYGDRRFFFVFKYKISGLIFYIQGGG
ncbi:hypothetical protein [Pseudomonas silesiensis]|uniref:hypothetical protein n=1 Tax=Pseudomonas silesiensis TaxID=1853130 RepID=UPI0034D65808